jgi:hypothetical protein
MAAFVKIKSSFALAAKLMCRCNVIGLNLTCMELIPSSEIALARKSRWPNTITFPKELKPAIPDYGPRALVFDSVSGSHYDGTSIAAMMGRPATESMVPRAQLQLLVHETGKLDGKFSLLVDLDAETTRALGKFLVELADRAEAGK